MISKSLRIIYQIILILFRNRKDRENAEDDENNQIQSDTTTTIVTAAEMHIDIITRDIYTDK